MAPVSTPQWRPSPERAARTQLVRFAQGLRDAGELEGDFSYPALYRWSVTHPERFWPALWRFVDVIAEPRPGGAPWDDVVRGLARMAPPDPVLGPRWFLGARLNFAENLLRFRDGGEALISWTEQGRRRSESRPCAISS